MFRGRGHSVRCFLEVAVGSVERSERATRSAPASRLRKLPPSLKLWRTGRRALSALDHTVRFGRDVGSA
jgi:hypothetical protein